MRQRPRWGPPVRGKKPLSAPSTVSVAITWSSSRTPSACTAGHPSVSPPIVARSSLWSPSYIANAKTSWWPVATGLSPPTTRSTSAGAAASPGQRPNDLDAPAVEAFAAAEAAKRRLVFQLYELWLPVVSRLEEPCRGLAFDLLSSQELPVRHRARGWCRHARPLRIGRLPPRARPRLELGEPYRTVLGHLRHEVGHYFWPIPRRRPGTQGRSVPCSATSAPSYAEALEDALPTRSRPGVRRMRS